MRQVAAMQSAINQYEQVTNVMPQLSAEISTLQWLYSVMNKGEGAMNIMNMNVPERAKAGGVEGVDYQSTMPMQHMEPPSILGKRQRYIHNGVLSNIDPITLNELASEGDVQAWNTIDFNSVQKPPKAKRQLTLDPTNISEQTPVKHVEWGPQIVMDDTPVTNQIPVQDINDTPVTNQTQQQEADIDKEIDAVMEQLMTEVLGGLG
jgi:hypothetical protein